MLSILKLVHSESCNPISTLICFTTLLQPIFFTVPSSVFWTTGTAFELQHVPAPQFHQQRPHSIASL